MTIKKQPKEISTDELIKVIQDNSVDEVIDRPNEHSVLQFLADFSIYPGDRLVNARTLYKLYYYHIDEPVSNLEFYLVLDSYLKYNNDKPEIGRRYYLNRKAKDLTNKLAEFLAARKQVKKAKNPHFRKHIERFIEAHGLKPGSANLPAQALYFFYDKWQYENGYKTRFTYFDFTAIIRLYFEVKRTAKLWCVVRVNKEFLDTNSQHMNTALEWGKKYSGKRKKKTDLLKKEKVTVKEKKPKIRK